MSGRSTPHAGVSNAKKRLSNNLSQHLRNVSLTNGNGASNDNVLASLRATQFVSFQPVLPAELIDAILHHVAVPDLLRFARVSRRLQEMVYDDTRWVQKLKIMNAWNESEARQRVELAMRKRMGALNTHHRELHSDGMSDLNGAANERPSSPATTLFDAGVEETRQQNQLKSMNLNLVSKRTASGSGFEELPLSSTGKIEHSAIDPAVALDILKNVKSIRGFARQEFGKVYAALAPLYTDLTGSSDHANAQIFQTYRDPEQQALILSNLKRFSRCDTSVGWSERVQRLEDVISIFENAVLKEFEDGLESRDIDGRMKRYAHVLVAVNDGSAAVESFIAHDPVLLGTARLGNPLDCLDGVAPGHVDLNPSRAFFEHLASTAVEQADGIDRVFPKHVDVFNTYFSRLCATVISNYLSTLLGEARSHGSETYAKAVSGTFEQCLRFVASLKPTRASPSDFAERCKHQAIKCYKQHVYLYLAEELSIFKNKSEAEVGHWEKELSDQQESAESYFMSNINRQAAKRDFLSSFKKVVMMPVHVIPSFGPSKSATSATPTTLPAFTENTEYRSHTPTLSMIGTPRSSTPQTQAPTDELAAKAAIMNSRLEGIKSLFSLDVALYLTHLAKASLDRVAVLVQMGGDHGKAAREQCDVIFVALLNTLGERHIKNGFDKAVNHLSNYNPSDVRRLQKRQAPNGGGEIIHASSGVAPLVTFLELVNIGDLIQQMVDVFYTQELVAKKIVDRDDFLDPAVKEKKRFEQMLDERVAAGLNKGIDVLVDEVEYIFASTQAATDFNPAVAGDKVAGVIDIGPTLTSQQVVDMIKSHTSMLVGSTDKNMLDVFMQEVGLRLFGAMCKHFKRQRISVDGAIKLISDINHYSEFITSLRQKPLMPYFHALRELGQIYLVYIDPPAAYFSTNSKGKRASILSSKGSTTSAQAKELATIIADTQRYQGIFRAEDVYEFAERRADWYLVKSDVERAMYGQGCALM